MHALRSRLGWVWQVACWALLIVSFSVLLAAVVVPRIGNATPYTILTGSMTESYPAGTLVIAKPIDADQLEVGDVITYQLESGKAQVVTHRITAMSTNMKGETLFQTKGDSNANVDENLVQAIQIKGKLWYSLPFVGYASALMSSDARWQLNYALAGLLALYSLYSFGSFIRDRRKNKNDDDEPRKPRFKNRLPKVSAEGTLGLPLRGGLMMAGLAALVAATIIPSGAFWNSQAAIVGTTVTAGTIANPTSAFCQVINTGTGNPEPGASCNTTLAANGCSGAWNAGVNAYLNFNIQNVVTGPSNNYGNNLQVKFRANLQSLGCNPPGLDWTGNPGPGIQAGSSMVFPPGYKCSTLPVVEASVQYYTASNPSVYLGQILFKRTTGPITCATGA